MRIPSGTVDQYFYLVAVDSADLRTRETGLASFTVYRSRNGGAATAMTTPTVAELDAVNMPGVYALLMDEDMTIAAGNDSEEMVFHVTHAGMAPVTRVIELYRRTVTGGNTLSVESDGDLTKVNTLDGHTPQTGDNYARLGAPVGASVSADIAAVKAETAAIVLDTNELQTDWTNGGRLDLIIDAILEDTGTTLPATLASISGYVSSLPDVNVVTIDGVAVTLETVFDANVVEISGDSTAADNCESFFDGTGYAGTNNVIPTVTTLTGHTPQTGDSYPIVSNVTYGNSALKTLIDTIDTVVDDILVDTGTTLPATLTTIAGYVDCLPATLDGTTFTAIPWNAAWDAEVQSECADALVAYDPPTNAEMEARTLVAANYATSANQTTIINYVDCLPATLDGTTFTAIPWNAAWDAEVQSECADALVAYDPPTNTEMEARTLVAANYATSANQTTIINYVDCLPATLDGVTFTAIPWNAAWDAEVQSECADAIVAYDPPTNAEMEARTLVAANYATAANQTTIINYVDTEVAAIKGVTDKLNTAMELDGLVYRFTANALEEGGGAAPTPSAIADAVWDKATLGHTTGGTFGYQVKTYIDAILEDTGTTIPGSLVSINNYLDTEVAAILDDVSKMAPILIGTVTGAGSGTEVYTYDGVVATVLVDRFGNVSSVTFT